MTFAQWRQDMFDADFVASELRKGIAPLAGGGLQYSGTAFFGEPLTLLETGVEFLEPIADADRSRIITSALEAALRSTDYGAPALIREVNKAARDFSRSPENRYVVATGLSFRYFENLNRVERSGYRLYVRQRLPRRLAEGHGEAKRRSRSAVHGEYPEDVPFKEYVPTWIHVRGRSVSEAMQRAVEALDLRRGIWNYALNRGTGETFPPPTRGPINEVLAGPVYSLHRPDGTLATEYDWVDPQYVKLRLSRKLQRKWNEVLADEEGIRSVLKRSPYRATLEAALRRYCRALDAANLSNSFLNLWSLLETLTGITPADGHDKMVKRASFIYAETERKTHEQVLHHLRRYRNSYVHAGEDSDQTGAYVHQLRVHTEQLLAFHLNFSLHFSSLQEVARFLDLPPDTGTLRHMIETQERKAREAAEVVHLAKEGLRFRQGN